MPILHSFKLLESTIFVQFHHLEGGPKFRIQRVYHHVNSITMINSLNKYFWSTCELFELNHKRGLGNSKVDQTCIIRGMIINFRGKKVDQNTILDSFKHFCGPKLNILDLFDEGQMNPDSLPVQINRSITITTSGFHNF